MSQQKWKFWGWEEPGKFFEVQKAVEGAPVGRRFSVSSPKPAQVRVHPTPRCVQEEQQPEKLLPLLLGTDSRLRRGLIQQQRQL